MYSDKNLLYVLTILEAIEKITLYAQSYQDADALLEANDQMNFNACQTLLLAIGEETKKIDKALKNEFSSIPWKQIANFRNRLAHDYRGVDPDVTYEIIIDYLPGLKKVMIEMLQKIDYEENVLVDAINSKYYKHLAYLLE